MLYVCILSGFHSKCEGVLHTFHQSTTQTIKHKLVLSCKLQLVQSAIEKISFKSFPNTPLCKPLHVNFYLKITSDKVCPNYYNMHLYSKDCLWFSLIWLHRPINQFKLKLYAFCRCIWAHVEHMVQCNLEFRYKDHSPYPTSCQLFWRHKKKIKWRFTFTFEFV